MLLPGPAADLQSQKISEWGSGSSMFHKLPERQLGTPKSETSSAQEVNRSSVPSLLGRIPSLPAPPHSHGNNFFLDPGLAFLL